MAAEIETNRDCLLETLEQAVGVAETYSRGGVEPGPYYVAEVWEREM